MAGFFEDYGLNFEFDLGWSLLLHAYSRQLDNPKCLKIPAHGNKQSKSDELVRVIYQCRGNCMQLSLG